VDELMPHMTKRACLHSAKKNQKQVGLGDMHPEIPAKANNGHIQ